MDNATQYQFDLVEVGKLLLRKQGIREGKWAVGVAFTIAAAHAGPTPDAARPSMIVSVDKVVLSIADANTPPTLVLDAAEIAKV